MNYMAVPTAPRAVAQVDDARTEGARFDEFEIHPALALRAQGRDVRSAGPTPGRVDADDPDPELRIRHCNQPRATAPARRARPRPSRTDRAAVAPSPVRRRQLAPLPCPGAGRWPRRRSRRSP